MAKWKQSDKGLFAILIIRFGWLFSNFISGKWIRFIFTIIYSFLITRVYLQIFTRSVFQKYLFTIQITANRNKLWKELKTGTVLVYLRFPSVRHPMFSLNRIDEPRDELQFFSLCIFRESLRVSDRLEP